MNNYPNKQAGQGLGIAGLVLGIIALILSVFGCTVVFSLPLAILGVILSGVGYSMAHKQNSSKQLIIPAFILSLIALIISILWIVVFNSWTEESGLKKTFQKYNNQWDQAEEVIEDMTTDTIFDMDDETLNKLEESMNKAEENAPGPAVPDKDEYEN